jgi:hypothetical protein
MHWFTSLGAIALVLVVGSGTPGSSTSAAPPAEAVPQDQQTQTAAFSEQGAARLQVSLPEVGIVEVLAQTTDFSPAAFPYVSSVSGYLWAGWGASFHWPRTVITSLRVSIRSQPVYIPMSAFCDLGNPHRMVLRATAKGFQVSIDGSDAGDSFEAVLEFEGTTLKRRKVHLNEFPDEMWEETTYVLSAW